MVCVPTHRITTHPGVLLLEPIREMGLSVNRVARDIRLPATRLHEIIHQRRGVTAATAIALGAYFNQNPEFWMNAQTAYELSKELVENGDDIRSRLRRHAEDLFPASAGINPLQGKVWSKNWAVPRKRGDEPVAGLNRSKLKLSKWAEEYERGQGQIRCPQRERNNARRYQRRASPLSCGTPSPLRYMKPRSNCAAASPSVARLRNPATSGAFWQLTSATTVNSQMQHDAATSRRCRCPMRPSFSCSFS